MKKVGFYLQKVKGGRDTKQENKVPQGHLAGVSHPML